MSWTVVMWLDDVAPVDHEEIGQSRLLAYLAAKPRMISMLNAFLAQIASLENVARQVLTLRSIWTATGVQLDTLGRIVRQQRGILTDAEYRLFILGRIFVNRGDGTIPQFVDLLDLLEIPSFQLHEYYPASFEVHAEEVPHPLVTGNLLFDMKSGGVNLRFVRSMYPEAGVFTTSPVPGTDTADTGRGLANPAGLTGGLLAYERAS